VTFSDRSAVFGLAGGDTIGGDGKTARVVGIVTWGADIASCVAGDISGDAADTVKACARDFVAKRSPTRTRDSLNSRRWLLNENNAITTAETKIPVPNPQEKPLTGPDISNPGEPTASEADPPDTTFVLALRPLRPGTKSGSERAGADPLPAKIVAGWPIQSRILSRTSAGTAVKRKPAFCVSSVQATVPSASILGLWSENQKRIVPFRGTGSKA
jgi:hypothetical protein